MKYSNNIKLLRVEKDLKQEELAQKVHVHQTAVSKWENGSATPDMQTADKLAAFFEVSLDYLLGRTDERTNSYYASNITDSQFVQGNGSVTIGGNIKISKEEAELLRVYKQSDIKGKARMLSLAVEIDEENKRQKSEVQLGG